MVDVELVISNGIVITVDKDRRVINNGSVAINDGEIVAVGSSREIDEKYYSSRTINADGKIIIPGLIDVHAHAGHGLIKTMAMNDDWEKVCGDVYREGSTPEFWRAEAQLAAMERIRFGVTCGVSLLGGGDTILRTDNPLYADAHCAGVAEVGARSVVAVGPTRAPHPLNYATWQGDKKTSYAVDFETQSTVTLTIRTTDDKGLSYDENIAITIGDAEGTLAGTAGADNIIGSSEEDIIDSGAGNDTVTGGAGADSIDGGTGINQVNYSGSVGVTVNLTTNINTGGDAQGDDLTSIRYVQGTDVADNITGDAFGNAIYGRDGDDTLNGEAGQDTIDGGVGDDSIDGGAGDDSIDGGIGNDTITGGADGATGDVLTGGAGADTIRGGRGADAIEGGAGDDEIYGGGGRDTILAGPGADTLTGGNGADQFVFENTDEGALILDFVSGTDTIVLEGMAEFEDAVTFATAVIDWVEGAPEPEFSEIVHMVVGDLTIELVGTGVFIEESDLIFT